jgi:hypothetical protein
MRQLPKRIASWVRSHVTAVAIVTVFIALCLARCYCLNAGVPVTVSVPGGTVQGRFLGSEGQKTAKIVVFLQQQQWGGHDYFALCDAARSPGQKHPTPDIGGLDVSVSFEQDGKIYQGTVFMDDRYWMDHVSMDASNLAPPGRYYY